MHWVRSIEFPYPVVLFLAVMLTEVLKGEGMKADSYQSHPA